MKACSALKGPFGITHKRRPQPRRSSAQLDLAQHKSMSGVQLATTLFVLVLATVSLASALDAIVEIDSQGVYGSITFSQLDPSSATTMTVALNGLNKEAGGYHVHVLPVLPGTAPYQASLCANLQGHFNPTNAGSGTCDSTKPQTCEIGDLSGKHGSLAGLSSISQSYTDAFLPLFGINSIVGRSVVIHKAAGPVWVCGTIVPQGSYNYGKAVFSGLVYGEVDVIQSTNSQRDTGILVNLAAQSGTTSSGHNWHVHINSVENNLCGNAGGHYAPLGPNQASCSPTNQTECEVGNLAGKNGPLTLGAVDANIGYFNDIEVPLSGPYSVLGRSIVVHEANGGANKIGCATLAAMSPRQAIVTFSGSDDVTGTITFSQVSPVAATKVTLKLTIKNSNAGLYHVHQLPVPSSGSCAGTGGHFNPFQVPSTSTCSVTSPSSDCEVGDLSGRHGSLRGFPTATQTYYDENLPLFTANSILGRSVVIHATSPGNPRLACGTIVSTNPTSTASAPATFLPVSQVVTTFSGTVSGTITLTQPTNDHLAPTTILVDLYYTDGSAATTGHTWHVHTDAGAGSGSACSVTGGHYNPYGVCTASSCNYATACGPLDQQFACEVGDLAGKHGTITIGATQGSAAVMFTDLLLPLSGPDSIVGRSITVHSGSTRLSCGTVGSSHHSGGSSDEDRNIGIAVACVAVLIIAGVAGTVYFLRFRQRSAEVDIVYQAMNSYNSDDDMLRTAEYQRWADDDNPQ
eukprot:m.57838 g.57838  ORF g.57838 m.57838 type:complete len:744 (+) comp7106_c0_seq1:171-2402(+)